MSVGSLLLPPNSNFYSGITHSPPSNSRMPGHNPYLYGLLHLPAFMGLHLVEFFKIGPLEQNGMGLSDMTCSSERGLHEADIPSLLFRPNHNRSKRTPIAQINSIGSYRLIFILKAASSIVVKNENRFAFFFFRGNPQKYAPLLPPLRVRERQSERSGAPRAQPEASGTRGSQREREKP